MSEQVAKKARTSKIIGTHSGTFHCDEALGTGLLKSLPQWKDAEIVRSRDPKVLADCDIVIDVGGVYDPATERYDHHQRGFIETFSPNHHTKLSSAGLVYKHYGKQIVAHHIGKETTNEDVETLHLRLYDGFVEAIDGIDNGVEQFEALDGGKVKSKYRSRTDLSSRVGSLNPSWNETSNDSILDAKFQEASKLATGEFFAALDRLSKSWLPGRDIVYNAIRTRAQTPESDPQGRLIIFTEFAPWKEHLFDYEKKNGLKEEEKPVYIVYPDESGKWRVQAVPKSPESFESRKALPEPWRGIRDDDLSKLTGIDDCIFVHAAGFIGGNKTKEGAIAMAKKALDM